MTPTKAGFYWARTDSCEWFNLIAEVHGESPFFSIRAWDRRHDTLRAYRSDQVEAWGDPINNPDECRKLEQELKSMTEMRDRAITQGAVEANDLNCKCELLRAELDDARRLLATRVEASRLDEAILDYHRIDGKLMEAQKELAGWQSAFQSKSLTHAVALRDQREHIIQEQAKANEWQARKIGELNQEITKMKSDSELAAGELMLPVPEPGTDLARCMAANVLMRSERDKWREMAQDLLRDKVEKMKGTK